jgi:D-threo-aldose 1-dehydrogenase
MAMITRRLGRLGLTFSELGLGGAPLGNLFAPVSDADAMATLESAWTAGMRVFDTAPLYGHGLSERRFGQFLRAKPREDFILATKVGRLVEPAGEADAGGAYKVRGTKIVFDYSRDGALRSLEASLKRLGLDRVDIVFIHDVGVDTHGPAEQPRRYRQALEGAWTALAELRGQGTIRGIGLGVNDWRVCVDFLRDADPDCFLLAGRYTLLEQGPLEPLLAECARRGVSVLIGGAYNSGILATGARPGAMYDYGLAPAAVLARVAAIEAIARRHGVKLPAAALRFPLAHPAVASVLIGARAAAEIDASMAFLDARIDPALWVDLKREGLIAARAPVPGAA